MNSEQETYRAGAIAIVGCPNVGKSTLFNQILQEKVAIISPTPQTTRNRILGVRTLARAQLVLLDTPGIHTPRHLLNQRLIQEARRALEDADLVLMLVVSDRPPGPGDRQLIGMLQAIANPVILVINKIDLIPKHELLPLINEYRKLYEFREIVPVSALSGENVERLLEVLVAYLPPGGPLYPEDTLTDQTMRAIAGETIREKILHRTRDEIPYTVAVMVEEFREEAERDLVFIRADVWVERESQKKILIGKAGRFLKEIGQQARLELEQRFGRKVYLELWVRVKKNWRQDEQLLKQLGY